MLAGFIIRTRITSMGRNILFHWTFWFISWSLYIFLLGDNQLLGIYLPLIQTQSVLYVAFLLSLVLALLVSFTDFLLSDRIMRMIPPSLLVFFRVAFSLTLGFFLVYTPFYRLYPLQDFGSVWNFYEQMPIDRINVIRFIVYFFVMAGIDMMLLNMVRKIGRLNISRWLAGWLNRPMEEERIFMFIDLKGSTTIAEKIGHKKFSRLAQDIFNDMSVMDNFAGQIYQYLGDGAIVSWSITEGLYRESAIKAFFAYNRLINRRRRYYQRNYGAVPEFKAGIHVGKVMVLQVGSIRRDISYNGDTMNTAARIEAKCNELKQQLLISDTLFQMLQNKKSFKYKNAGEIALKGKKAPVALWGVKEL